MSVVPQDVDSFGEGNVLKVLTIDLHDLKQEGRNEEITAGLIQRYK